MSTKQAERIEESEASPDRNLKAENRFKLRGVDHVGLPCSDPHESGKFIEQILGGVEFYRAGYSDDDRKLGRLRHIFYLVGDQLIEAVEQEDRKSYANVINPDGGNTNPHWAFRVGPGDLAGFMKHLEREGIPFNGPRSHRRVSGVSIYFRDIDGNNLEVICWEPLSPDVNVIPMRGGAGSGPIRWSELSHNWRPRA